MLAAFSGSGRTRPKCERWGCITDNLTPLSASGSGRDPFARGDGPT